jgi:acetyltransferase-like isoleucine patch superfamily enzyme
LSDINNAPKPMYTLEEIIRGAQRRSPLLARMAAWISFHRCRRRFQGAGNAVSYHATSRFKRAEFEVTGRRNRIEIGRDCSLGNVRFIIKGDDHSVVIGDGCSIAGGTIWMEDDHGHLEIGRGTTIEEASFSLVEPRSSIRIGPECMLAQGIDFRTSDSHSIIDSEGNRINWPANIEIGEHTWICANASILKGVEVAGDSIIGGRAVVTHSFPDKNVVIAGVPAVVIRRGVTWRRERAPLPNGASLAEFRA